MDDQLVNLVKCGHPLEVIAQRCDRTVGAVLSRMEYIAHNASKFAQLSKIIKENL